MISGKWGGACLFAVAFTAFGAHAQTYSRTEQIVYHDNLNRWVLGQTARVTCAASIPAATNCDGDDHITQATFDAVTGKLTSSYSFGRLNQIVTYNSDGTVATVKDGNNNVTSLSNWKRGFPRTITYAATPESPAGPVETEVDNNGWILSVTDELGARTCYEHDAMGRVNLILHPSEVQGSSACDDSTWEETTIEFRPMTSSEWRPPGVEAGQWRQYTATGNYQKIVYFDALWRPVLTNEYDATNTSGTLRAVSTAYDAAGRVAFQSYPSGDIVPAAIGVWTFYDSLGRVKQVRQDSEQGQLITRTEYLANQIRVTAPNGEVTQTTFQAFDQPSFDAPVRIEEPLGRTTSVVRDSFGKPVEIERNY